MRRGARPLPPASPRGGGRGRAAVIAPASYEEAAAALREAAAARRSLRIRGAGTKLGWAAPVDEPDVWLSTRGLAAIVEHNAGDLTAVLEAGVRLEDAQDAFAEAGQMLALDPPGAEATVGGVVATGDAGPLRHRYGGPRDLLLGATVALADGTVARSGGKVIKNVAGYDLAKLFAGSFGTLGAIGQVVVRLHPRPPERATVTGETDDPEELGRAAVALAAAPLELEALDVRWSRGRGALVAQAGGVALAPRIQRLRDLLGQAGLAPSVVRDDGDVWSAQRS
ncbi:MAG: FAD-binding oxidoreductase, partial [Thermoleophilia bacterium]|nr:FAD-binding oxidoreductase [Thermoleophilia bacterium]